MARKDSDNQKKSMSLLFRGKAIFKPLNTGRIGARVAVSLYKGINGAKKYEGTLLSRSDETLSIDSDGRTLLFDNANVASVRLVYTGGF